MRSNFFEGHRPDAQVFAKADLPEHVTGEVLMTKADGMHTHTRVLLSLPRGLSVTVAGQTFDADSAEGLEVTIDVVGGMEREGLANAFATLAAGMKKF
jgi:hypothetical protein